MSETPPIQTDKRDGVTIITLSSHFESLYENLLPELAALLDLADSIDPPRMLLDLSATKYFGSAFIGFLISLSSRLSERTGRFGLANVAPFCRMALETTKSNLLLELFETVDAGVTELRWTE